MLLFGEPREILAPLPAAHRRHQRMSKIILTVLLILDAVPSAEQI